MSVGNLHQEIRQILWQRSELLVYLFRVLICRRKKSKNLVNKMIFANICKKNGHQYLLNNFNCPSYKEVQSKYIIDEYITVHLGINTLYSQKHHLSSQNHNFFFQSAFLLGLVCCQIRCNHFVLDTKVYRHFFSLAYYNFDNLLTLGYVCNVTSIIRCKWDTID